MLLKVALVDVIFSLTDYAANSLFNQTSKVVFDWDAVTGSTTETDEVELGPVPSDDAGRDAYALAVAQRVMEALLNEDWDWLTAQYDWPSVDEQPPFGLYGVDFWSLAPGCNVQAGEPVILIEGDSQYVVVVPYSPPCPLRGTTDYTEAVTLIVQFFGNEPPYVPYCLNFADRGTIEYWAQNPNDFGC